MGNFIIYGEEHQRGKVMRIDAWSAKADAINTAQAVTGFDRVIVVDNDTKTVVWDSIEAARQTVNGAPKALDK